MENNFSQQFPPEWQQHSACWIAWPARKEVWSLGFDLAKQAYAEVINNIARYEPVNLLVCPLQRAEAEKACTSSNLTIIEIPLDDSWARDTMPLFVVDRQGRLMATKWRFNAWGEKFLPWDHDAALGNTLIDRFKWPAQYIDMVLEGGSIHVDGQGTLMTTAECLLHPNRNPDLSQADIEKQLRTRLGVNNFIWLPRGLHCDTDTDGHIDNIACFADAHTVVTMTTPDKTHPNHAIYQRNKEILANARSGSGLPYKLVEITQPEPRIIQAEELATSYINYYVANDAVIIPSFDDEPHDRAAKEVIQDLYPSREIIQVNALPIVAGGGGIHCITMQQPGV